MAEVLTKQQGQAVKDRGGKLLVSAAAGSGKTKVLVDRLLMYILDPVDPANIDDFLIITYTKAAAAELRVKIASKLSEHLQQQPENRHLQRQMQRLYLTKISTVHAFCTDLLREYAYRLDISGDFRVAEENECHELQLRVMERLLEDAYGKSQNDPDFRAFVDTQGLGRDDRQVPDIIFKVFNSARCHLDPKKWLQWCLSATDISGCEDAAQTVWGKYLMDDLHRYLELQIQAMNRCACLADASDHMESVAANLRDTVAQMEQLRQYTSWDDIVSHNKLSYKTLSFSKKITDLDLKERIKVVREACKKGLASKLKRFTDDSAQIIADLSATAASSRGLVALTEKFMADYAELKRSKRVLDFSDLEHIALDLLLGKSRSAPTEIAGEVSSRYREVMVDEYQDSNAVQDAIFGAITGKKQNCFMVGDVKQSIYQFRLADPGIFLAKYHEYVPAEKASAGEGRKVLLSHNFRSAGSVINAVNHVFSHCMSEEVGGLDYGPDEALREGVPHQQAEEKEIELHILSVREKTYEEEANYTAERIAELLDGTHKIRHKDTFRPIRPEDIVILLRSPGSTGAHFASALARRGIRCSFGGSTDILQTEEVQTLRSILQVIDNPLQDIPMLTALSGRVFAFTADDLAWIRSRSKKGSIYDALLKSDHPKAKAFIETLDSLRNEARLSDLSRLIQAVFARTRIDCIYGAMADGPVRMENLQSFSLLASGFDTGDAKSLSRFLKYLEALDEKGVPGAVDQTTAGAVTVMSIHKSKGLEFPVVFLCCLSREFNRDKLNEQVLCDRELGLGMNCVDPVNRVRYPSVAKRAIAVKMQAESLSEEMRVLYVAMTRPRDRLIMTYAEKKPENALSDLVAKMDIYDPVLITKYVNCPGKWVLYSALRRGEAGALFKLGGYPKETPLQNDPWHIVASETPEAVSGMEEEAAPAGNRLTEQELSQLKSALEFRYPYAEATEIPSKQTATQLKGRQKDAEIAENTVKKEIFHNWRVPSFVEAPASAAGYGTAMHTVMQHISYDACDSLEGVQGELARLQKENYLSEEYASRLDAHAITAFFATELGRKMREAKKVLREFKFSLLVDAGEFYGGISDEQILLQGVVDCAILEDDGITVLDFKTDSVKGGISPLVDKYRPQVEAYSRALSRIYQKPVKASYLYFFSASQLYKL